MATTIKKLLRIYAKEYKELVRVDNNILKQDKQLIYDHIDQFCLEFQDKKKIEISLLDRKVFMWYIRGVIHTIVSLIFLWILKNFLK